MELLRIPFQELGFETASTHTRSVADDSQSGNLLSIANENERIQKIEVAITMHDQVMQETFLQITCDDLQGVSLLDCLAVRNVFGSTVCGPL